MRILLVEPDVDHGKFRRYHVRFAMIPSLSLYQVAACTPREHEIEIISEWYDKIDFNKNYDIVGISTFTKDAPRAYEIAERFRKKGITVILGGIHPTVLPEEAKEHADSVVVGEAEENWPILLNDFKNNKLKPFYLWGNKVDPSNIPSPRRDLDELKPLSGAIQASRGCPYKCDFCQLTGLKDTVHRRRPIEHVIQELKEIKQDIIWFQDASLTINPNYSKALFKSMVKNNINKSWVGFGNANLLLTDEEFLKLAKQAGCKAWMVGFESISQKTLDDMIHKRTNKVEKFQEMINKVGKYEMGIWGSFIFGFDTDTTEVFENTYDTISNWGLETASFNILTPFPKTAFFDNLDKQGRIITKDWSKYNLHNVVFQPKNMTVEELKNGVNWIKKKYYRYPEIIKNVLHSANKSRSWSSLLFSFSSNVVQRKIAYMEATGKIT